jgi:hypothetical protein
MVVTSGDTTSGDTTRSQVGSVGVWGVCRGLHRCEEVRDSPFTERKYCPV